MTHQYIVIERGTGEIVANLVSEKAARDERLPELETLIIIEALLDLLQAEQLSLPHSLSSPGLSVEDLSSGCGSATRLPGGYRDGIMSRWKFTA